MTSRASMATNARYRQLAHERNVGVWADPEEVRARVQSELGICSGCGDTLHPDNWKKHVDSNHYHEVVSFIPKGTLTTDEQIALERCESVIKAELDAFVRVGLALAEINASRLYRAQYATFEAYLDQRWNLKRTRGYALMQAAQVVQRLSEISDIEIKYESHAKELANLEPEAAVAVYRFVKEVSPTGKATTTALRSAAAVIKEAMQTGAIYDSDGHSISLGDATPDHVKATVTEDVYENMLRMQEHIQRKGTPRHYVRKAVQMIASRGGEMVITGLEPGTYYVSVWVEGESA